MKILKKIFILLQSKVWFYGLLNGVAANIELKNFLRKINSINTLVDIGSNKGQFILLLERYFPDAKVYSFEPIKEILNKQKKFFNYKKDIFFFNFGLGCKNAISNFYITNKTDSSSFLQINKNNNTSDNYVVREKRKIKIIKLDKILIKKKLLKPILVKIDVQGYELEVLKGSKKMLNRIDYLLLEVSKNRMYKKQPLETEIVKYLKKYKFKVVKSSEWMEIKNTNFLQRDILFKKT